MPDRNPTKDHSTGSGTAVARFAPGCLMRRRLSLTGGGGAYARHPSTRPTGGVPRLPGTPLPPGLLPLPAGFELATTSVPAAAAS